MSQTPPAAGPEDPSTGLRHRHRPGFAVLGVLVTLLFMAVELQLFRSYGDTENTTKEFVRTTDATTAVANVQREALTLVVAAERLEEGQSLADIDQRRGFLERQFQVFESAAAATDVHSPLVAVLRAVVKRFDRQIAALRFRGRARGVAAAKPQLGRTLDRFSMQVKRLFDEEEQELYKALGATLAERGDRQRLLVILGALGLLIAIAAAFVVRRGIRSDFVRAYDALAGEVRERTALQEQLSHRALHDSLTGLGNRQKFRDELRDALMAQPGPGSIAVLYVDLDEFKSVNDAAGHDGGDELLRQAADRLRRVLRCDDHVARLGGDEFAALLTDIDGLPAAADVADRLIEAFREPFTVNHRQFGMGASIGIAMIDGTHDDPERAIHQADLAMYAAKNDGKGAFRYFSPDMTEAAERRQQLEDELRVAQEQDEIELYFQPIVDLDADRTVGLEALIRWQHPERGLLAPGEFLPVAEDSGLIVPLGRHVLREACRTAAAWPAPPDGAAPWVSVNFSPRQLREHDLVEQVRSALAASGLAAERLVIEISEMTMLNDTRRITPMLAELRAIGVRIALDDFGTGHTSLGYLRFLPVDILKVDKCFLDHIAEDSHGARLADAILRLGSRLRFETIAEGIEHPEQVAALRSTGCRLAQGYHFSRPVPADAVPSLLSAALGHVA